MHDLLRQQPTVATALALAVVHPQAGNLLGGHFTVWRSADGSSEVIDARERAPTVAHRDLFIGPDGAVDNKAAILTPTASAVPGTVPGLLALHDRHGKLPWAELFKPAIKQATEGFRITPRLHALLMQDTHGKVGPPGKARGLKEQVKLRGQQAARRYFFDENGEPLPEGTLLKNPELMKSLGQSGDKPAEEE